MKIHSRLLQRVIKSLVTLLVGLQILLAAALPSLAQTPASQVDPERLEKAIEKGVLYILRQQRGDGSVCDNDCDNATIALALLECRVSIKNPALQKLLADIAAERTNDTRFLALRAEVMALAGAAGGAAGRKAVEPQIAADLKTVLGNQLETGIFKWRLTGDPHIETTTEVLAHLAGCQIEGYRVTDAALMNGVLMLLKYQNSNGGWSHSTSGKDQQGSDHDQTLRSLMTLAAFGRDVSHTDDGRRLNEALSAAVQGAFRFLGDAYRDEAKGQDDRDRWFFRRSYYIGRVLRYLPLESINNTRLAADWINPMLGRQQESGAWRGNPLETAWVLYLLAQLRARPVVAEITDTTKPPLANRTLVNLTQQMSRWLPTGVTYARYRLSEIRQYRQLPLILIETPDNWKLVDEEKKLLRQYVAGGGTILLSVPLQPKEAVDSLSATLTEVWPGTKLEPLGRGDAVWSARDSMTDRPVCHGLNDGVRNFLFAVGRDTLTEISFGRMGPRGSNLSLLSNIVAYATEGRLEAFGPLRSATTSDVQPVLGGQKMVAIGAVTAKSSLFEKQSLPAVPYNGFAAAAALVPKSEKLELLGPKALNAANDNLPMCDLAYLPLTASTTLDDAEIAGLKQYLDGGGFLLVEIRLGDVAADRTAQKLIEQLGLKSEAARGHELLTGQFPAGAKGFDVARLAVRRDGKLLPEKETDLRLLKSGDRIVGIYSPLDMVVSASGISCFGLRGYAGDDACRLLANLLIYRTTR